MAVSSYAVTINALSLNAAYRPIIIRVFATDNAGGPLPPVVYCDIYFNGVYYKTMAKSQPEKKNLTNSEFQFDLQDAAQEFLKSQLGPIAGAGLFSASEGIVKVFVRCRASGIDARGFIIPEAVEPVQATGGTPAEPGTGLESNSFFVLNSALQHDDNQNLQAHLNSYKFVLWTNQYFPVTHRPNPYYITSADSDYFPVANPANLDIINTIDIFVQFTGQTGGAFLHLSTALTPVTGALLYAPAGPKNLATVFPSLDFKTVSNYYIQLVKSSGPGSITQVATSPMYVVKKSCADGVRIHFVNYLGTIDAMNFELINIDHVTKSERWQAPDDYPLNFTKHGINRANVSSNNVYTCTSVEYSEEAQNWVAEILDSSKAWIEYLGKQELPDNYLPIVITDGKITQKKEEDRFVYEMQLEFTLSHDKITPRN